MLLFCATFSVNKDVYNTALCTIVHRADRAVKAHTWLGTENGCCLLVVYVCDVVVARKKNNSVVVSSQNTSLRWLSKLARGSALG